MTPILEQIAPLERTGTSVSLRYIYRIEPWIATCVLLALLPALFLVAIIIAVLSRRAPLVRHRRIGWQGSPLRMLKFRTMWERGQPWAPLFTIEDVTGTIPATKTGEDDRVTSRFAKWCRRHSIDELPQLYHVARGEMSFVGPRPITRAELDEHYRYSANEVLSLRPGLTGLWQMMGRNRLSYANRERLDLRLVRCASPRLYLYILFRSIPRVLWGHDAY